MFDAGSLRMQQVLARLTRGGALAACLATVALAMPAAASAGTDTIHYGTLYPSTGWVGPGPRHSLTAVTFSGSYTQYLSGNPVQGCVNATSDATGAWVGTTYCGYPGTSHPYCGSCAGYRRGWASAHHVFGQNGYVGPEWTQTW